VICVSDGVMYWGDAQLFKIERAFINGTGRRILRTELAVCFAFLYRDGHIYITDWISP